VSLSAPVALTGWQLWILTFSNTCPHLDKVYLTAGKKMKACTQMQIRNSLAKVVSDGKFLQ